MTARSRQLASALEPVAGQVYFSPECHASYAALGFAESPRSASGVALPDGPAYFASRGSILGQVPGEVVAAAFGVFNPEVVIPAVSFAWSITDAATICAARSEGAIAQLERILGRSPDGLAPATVILRRACDGLRPEGKPLFAGLQALGLPETPLGNMWRLTDQLREYRGDAHVAAWTVAGFDATEIGLLTEAYWGLPLRSYVRSRGWPDGALDAAEDRLVRRSLLTDGSLSERGRQAREEVELTTDRACRPIIEAIGEELKELNAILLSWSNAIRGARGYLVAGPHDLAEQYRPA